MNLVNILFNSVQNSSNASSQEKIKWFLPCSKISGDGVGVGVGGAAYSVTALFTTYKLYSIQSNWSKIQRMVREGGGGKNLDSWYLQYNESLH